MRIKNQILHSSFWNIQNREISKEAFKISPSLGIFNIIFIAKGKDSTLGSHLPYQCDLLRENFVVHRRNLPEFWHCLVRWRKVSSLFSSKASAVFVECLWVVRMKSDLFQMRVEPTWVQRFGRQGNLLHGSVYVVVSIWISRLL